jgi:uncharacterized membrane protein YoaK (UPF0700 family)
MEQGRAATDDDAARLHERLPPLLSIIAGMVDLSGFVMLGQVFTAHITGNLVLAIADSIDGGPFDLVPVLSLPVFMAALAVVWLLARWLNLTGQKLARSLLVLQLVQLVLVLAISVAADTRGHPDGTAAGLAAMIAVSAMACQYALFRLAIPSAISTAVMTGNLTNTVLALMDLLSPDRPLLTVDQGRLRHALLLLLGFIAGCGLAAIGIVWLGNWAWAFPAALAALVVVLVPAR